MIKVLSNNNHTIRKTGTRYTQTLHRIRIRSYTPEQRIPDVTVQSNEYLPDSDVKVSEKEWYAASWEMDFDKQIDKHTTSEAANNAEQMTTQETTHTDDAEMSNEVTGQPTTDTSNAELPSPEFSNLTTDVGDNP